MAPPTYADLGKAARDLFNKGYNVGFMKIEHTSKAGANKEVEFKTNAAHNIAAGKLFGSLDVKYKLPAYGVTFTEKWNTDNSLGTIIEIQDQIARGTKLTFDSSYSPNLGKRSGILKAEWANPQARLNAEMALEGSPVLNMSGVVSHDIWLFGIATSLDTAHSKFKRTNVAFGCQTPDYTLHSFMNDGNEFGASLYHHVTRDLELGAQLGWTIGDQSTRFAVGSKYAVSADHTLRAKLNNQSQLTLATTHNLSNQLKLTMSTQLSLSGGVPDAQQKFGIGLEYEI